jgi:hypothetical protein
MALPRKAAGYVGNVEGCTVEFDVDMDRFAVNT